MIHFADPRSANYRVVDAYIAVQCIDMFYHLLIILQKQLSYKFAAFRMDNGSIYKFADRYAS